KRNGIMIDKRWVELEGRTFLVEDVGFRWIIPHLRPLPIADQAAIQRESPDGALYVVSTNRLLPKLSMSSEKASDSIQMAYSKSPTPNNPAVAALQHIEEPGFVIDYSYVTSSTNRLHGDITYRVSGVVD